MSCLTVTQWLLLSARHSRREAVVDMKLALLVASVASCNAFIWQPLRTGQPTAVRRGKLVMALPTADDIATTEFMQSFDLAAQVCDGLLEADADAAALVPAFMTTSDAARGWFVTSLTTPEYREAALHPSVVEAVVQQPAEQDPVTRLMIMNVVNSGGNHIVLSSLRTRTFPRRATLLHSPPSTPHPSFRSCLWLPRCSTKAWVTPTRPPPLSRRSIAPRY